MERELVKVKGFNGEQEFEPSITPEDLVQLEEAEKAAGSVAKRVQAQASWLQEMLRRSVPNAEPKELRLSARDVQVSIAAVYQWCFPTPEELQASPLGS